MEESENAFAQCLTELDSSRKAFEELSGQFTSAFGQVSRLLNYGEVKAALELMERNREAVVRLCGLARSATEQQVLLVLKLAELTCSLSAGSRKPEACHIEQTVNRFVLNALSYLDCERRKPLPREALDLPGPNGRSK